MAQLSTHVLDISRGRPAEGVRIDLYKREGESRQHLTASTTNADGRTDTPMLSGDTLPTGEFELVFQAGTYFRAQGVTLPDPPFLDEVVIRFGIADSAGKYHVPLLLAPYGYSTYRGS